MKNKNLLKSFIFYNSLLFFITFSFLFIYFISFKFELHLLDCIVFRELGIYCPGCGGTRSLIFLLRLDFLNSFLSYPPLIFSLFLIICCDILALLSIIKKDLKYIKLFKTEYFLIIPVIIVLNFFIRIILLFNGVDFMPTL